MSAVAGDRAPGYDERFTNGTAESMINRLSSIGTVTAAAAAALLVAGCAGTMAHQHDAGAQHGGAAAHGAMAPDVRVAVRFPEPMRTHTLSNMRDHLRALGEIQNAMAKGAYDDASRIAEQNLGMTSLAAHGAHEVAPFMPEAMQALGTAMHRSASQFATEVQTAGATGDAKPALAALARVTQACVACHAGFRME